MAPFEIAGRDVGPGKPTYIIAEMSANHGQDYDEAVRIVHAAKAAGADAIKLQTYTPDTMTLDCESEHFRIGSGTIWEGKGLHELYGQAYTPWPWHEKLQQVAHECDLDFFSSPFDNTAVDFLEALDVPAYKVASFEVVDIPLLQRIGQTAKPVIMSTGMATLEEIEEGVAALREAGAPQVALLKCTSAYPAPPESMNLSTMQDLASRFDVPVGLSDHTLGIEIPVTAVALGACVIEKHFTLSRAKEGPDSAFSLEPDEFAAMVRSVRIAEKAIGSVQYGTQQAEAATRVFRRSLFVVRDIEPGEPFTAENVRSIRPGHGLPPKHLGKVLGRTASTAIPRGTPLDWKHVA